MTNRKGDVTITNTFHGTSVVVRPRPDWVLSPGQMARIRRELCGMDDCRCWHYEAEGYAIEPGSWRPEGGGDWKDTWKLSPGIDR